MAVIRGNNAPDKMEYSLDGASFVDLGRGVVGVAQNNTVVGFVQPAWAIDADGKSLPTRYTVVDGRLSQQVDHRGAAYPVVADPTISLGWYVYVRYSRAEVQNFNYWLNVAGGVFMVGLMCGSGLGPITALACAAALTAYLGSIIETIQDAKNANQCVELRFTYNGILVGWRRYNC